MQGKPFFPAGLAAEDRPLVLRLRDLYEGSAVAALEGPPDDDGADFLGMLPVQALAVSRTKLNAPVRRLCHPYQLAAFQAAEGAQGFLFPRRTDMIVRAVPVGVAAAVGTAVFLRDAVGCKFPAAHGAYSLPLHRYPPPSPAVIYRGILIQARKKIQHTPMLPKKHIIYYRVHVSPDVSYNKGMINRGVRLITTVPPVLIFIFIRFDTLFLYMKRFQPEIMSFTSSYDF